MAAEPGHFAVGGKGELRSSASDDDIDETIATNRLLSSRHVDQCIPARHRRGARQVFAIASITPLLLALALAAYVSERTPDAIGSMTSLDDIALAGGGPATQASIPSVEAGAMRVALSTFVNQFGLSMLSELDGNGSDGQVFISPLGVITSLSLAALGTTPGGIAQSEIMALWGVTDSRELKSHFHDVQSQVEELIGKHGDVQFSNANSIWVKKTIKKPFVEDAKEIFHALVAPLPVSPEPINGWVKQATGGMIPSVIDQIDPLTVAMLVNAVYFKGAWAPGGQFKTAATKRGTFASVAAAAAAKRPVPCAMMMRTGQIRYAEADGLQVVELPYGKEARFAATILVPADGAALDALVSRLAQPTVGAAQLLSLMQRLTPKRVELHLPRFKLEFGIADLSNQLKATFGVKEAFVGSNGFSAMSDDPDVHLSSLLHKAVVEVNEHGTEAAAAAVAVMKTRSIEIPRPPEKVVVVDRPFIFLLHGYPRKREEGGWLLFAGIVKNPKLDLTGV
eukprot:TRINITY_DN34843_c0_g1_i1.p1 TRINITY_DN34843_c0_g1~~TRINITY_DN34843_c0_g1_i1.p1  ORF type:complete len:520 (-),score=90.94 TRINITY_DN34843_c0_g1_i1:80-1606(-)